MLCCLNCDTTSCFNTFSCQGLAMASTWSPTQLLCRPKMALEACWRVGFSCEQFLPPSQRHWTSSFTRKLQGPDTVLSCSTIWWQNDG
jgi:hypothetical protein